MRLRRTRIPQNAPAQRKTCVPSGALTGAGPGCVWVFAAWVTTREGATRIFVQTLNTTVFEPSGPLLLELQRSGASPRSTWQAHAERRHDAGHRRQKITGLGRHFQQSATSRQANVAGSTELQHRISMDDHRAGWLRTPDRSRRAENRPRLPRERVHRCY